MTLRGIAGLVVSVLSLFSCSSVPPGLGPLETVEKVDVERYMGRWYEIARFTRSFEKGIVGATAEYSLRSDGKITVLNSGFKNGLDGKYVEAKGVARVPDPAKPGRLRVSFFRPFEGDYLLFGLDEENYSWALVGSDDRKYLWFLARTPEVDETRFSAMKALAEQRGYQLGELYRVPQKAR